MAHIGVWVMGGMRPIHLTGVRWPIQLWKETSGSFRPTGPEPTRAGLGGRQSRIARMVAGRRSHSVFARQSDLGDFVERIESSSVASRLAHLGHSMLRPLDP